MNSGKTLKQITKENNKLTLQLQKLANSNTAKTFKFNSAEAEKQRVFNASEAAISRDWQTQMSNTSHQREVKDLIAAGLNPVLSANSGAQSYTTTAANASAASGVADSSAVGALAGIQSSQNSARASIYGSDASLKASQAVASAQRYAADKAYAAAVASAEAHKYSADKHYDAQVYAADLSHQTAMDKPVVTAVGLLDKIIGRSGAKVGKDFYSGAAIGSGVGTVNSAFLKLGKNAIKNFVNSNKFSYTKALTRQGVGYVGRILSLGGYSKSFQNYNLLTKFLLSGNAAFFYALTKAASNKPSGSKSYRNNSAY